MSKIKALIDTNVVIDFILQRGEFYADAKAIFDLAEDHRIEGCISSSAVTDIFYLVNKQLKDRNLVYQQIDKVTRIFTVLPVLDTTIKKALAFRWKDFEDAVQYIAARENKIISIVTRNTADYEVDGVAVSPSYFLSLAKEAQSNASQKP